MKVRLIRSCAARTTNRITRRGVKVGEVPEPYACRTQIVVIFASRSIQCSQTKTKDDDQRTFTAMISRMHRPLNASVARALMNRKLEIRPIHLG